MDYSDPAVIVGDDGLLGTVLGPSDKPDEVAIRLHDGREISIPASALSRDPDGTWRAVLATWWARPADAWFDTWAGGGG